jgi:uncharacterized tellurite resistance protein B-like protein
MSMDVPDVASLTSPVAKLRSVADDCSTDLDAYSRWVGRNPDAPKTVAAVALLPAELVTTAESAEARQLWSWIGETLKSRKQVVCATDEVLRHCSSFGVGKLAKSEAVLLAQLLEKGGYGIEPDVRFGGLSLRPGGEVVLFEVPPGSAAVASPQYTAATVLLHLAVAVSAADGSISPVEKNHLQKHLSQALELSDAERLRLSAHLEWLLRSPPSLSAVRKRVDPLDQRQRLSIASFIIGVAGADGEISPDEIRVIGKIYPMLGLDPERVYGHVHEMTSAGLPHSEDGPAVVIRASRNEGYLVPSHQPPARSVKLDMRLVNAKLAESAKISAILNDIFIEDEAMAVPSPIAEGPTFTKLTPAQGALLTLMIERSQWSRSEFESLTATCGLLPDGAFDSLNEAAFDHAGGPLLEGDDPIHVELETAKELLS